MNSKSYLPHVVICVVAILFFVLVCMWGFPQYRVYSQKLRGEADFKEAEINRQIRVEEARAEEEALMLEANGEAEREKIRASATAQAIEKIGATLEKNGSYLRWMWINEIAGGSGERIYIPTEAGMPLLEAGATAK